MSTSATRASRRSDTSPLFVSPIQDYYRSAQGIPDVQVTKDLQGTSGFFRFGRGIVCYGRTTGPTNSSVKEGLFDASESIQHSNGTVVLPFELKEVVDNLRYERYVDRAEEDRWVEKSWAKKL